MKHALLVSSGLIHPPALGRFWLGRALRALPGFRFTSVGSLEALPRLDLARTRALVLYFHHRAISAEALAAFERFVRAGGGVLALHAATASFKTTAAYFEILGGRFTGHGPVETFTVGPAPAVAPPFTGLPAFAVTDELYQHEFVSDVQVQFTAPFHGEPVPVVWTRAHGQGRVCYAAPGHTAGTLRHPVYQRLLRQALQWAAG